MVTNNKKIGLTTFVFPIKCSKFLSDFLLLKRGVFMSGKKKMKVTAKEFGETVGVEYAVAANVLKFLVMSGVADEAGSQKTASGKGKPSTVYEFPTIVTLDLTTKVKPLVKKPKEVKVKAVKEEKSVEVKLEEKPKVFRDEFGFEIDNPDEEFPVEVEDVSVDEEVNDPDEEVPVELQEAA